MCIHIYIYVYSTYRIHMDTCSGTRKSQQPYIQHNILIIYEARAMVCPRSAFLPPYTIQAMISMIHDNSCFVADDMPQTSFWLVPSSFLAKISSLCIYMFYGLDPILAMVKVSPPHRRNPPTSIRHTPADDFRENPHGFSMASPLESRPNGCSPATKHEGKDINKPMGSCGIKCQHC